jgi:cell division protein FtsI (penicillin-binding protein 3)
VHGTEQLTFSGVLAKSSNIGTIEVAQQLGFGKLYQYLRAFGFGAPTNVGLPGETSGLLPPLGSWSGTTGATIAFGQGMSVNALQMASVYATIANGGVRMPPRLVNGTVAADGTVTPLEAGTGIRVVSAATARTISDMLEGVTTIDGTAPAAALAGYRVAGKTGTADRIDPVTGRYQSGHHVASFVGFAPADKPAVVVEAVLDDPLHPYFGGVAAAPVFHSVLDFTLKTLRVPPTGTEPPRLALEWK